MTKSSRIWVVIALEVIALEVGAYTYAALYHQIRLPLLAVTGVLCFFAAIIGMIVTRPKAQAISLLILVLGIITLAIGLYFLNALNYHERAYTPIGVGILGLIGGSLGIIVPRSITAALSETMILGMLALGMGLYFLTVLNFHGRAYMVLGTGTLCLLGGLVGIILTHSRTTTTKRQV
ncbi:MAG TPA: hypothetical protein VNE38_07885 [Ktedonobacteraceae bacterium]|nr:hypothetical protein [Ktedonobacteraceae bacterium]